MSLTRQQYNEAKAKVLAYFDKAAIKLSAQEMENIEIADFGLERPNQVGLQLVTYVNTDRCCAKEMVLFPGQVCPEHSHPPIGKEPGKEETFRCRWGKVYLYVPGVSVSKQYDKIPADMKDYFTVWHEIVLNPGDQYTIAPNTLHWFHAGEEGAVISEFSTKSRDEFDIFTDPNIKRVPQVI